MLHGARRRCPEPLAVKLLRPPQGKELLQLDEESEQQAHDSHMTQVAADAKAIASLLKPKAGKLPARVRKRR